MSKIEISCPAKVNLFLNIKSKNEELNLHDLTLYNQTINLYDEIIIYENKLNQKKEKTNKIEIKSKDNIPLDETNSTYKAAKIFFEYTGIEYYPLTIEIIKKIPTMSGLGGESTDAAGVLLGLDRLYNTNLSRDELLSLAFKVGSDTPYFIVGGYAKVTDYGKKIHELTNPYYNYFITITPNLGLSTKEMFQRIDELPFEEKEYINNILHNDFIKVMPEDLKKLREYLMQYKDLSHSLSGSGSTYFIASPTPAIPNEVITGIRENFPEYKLRKCKKAEGHRLFKMI